MIDIFLVLKCLVRPIHYNPPKKAQGEQQTPHPPRPSWPGSSNPDLSCREERILTPAPLWIKWAWKLTAYAQIQKLSIVASNFLHVLPAWLHWSSLTPGVQYQRMKIGPLFQATNNLQAFFSLWFNRKLNTETVTDVNTYELNRQERKNILPSQHVPMKVNGMEPLKCPWMLISQ